MTQLDADHATDESSRKAMEILGDPFTGKKANPLASFTDKELKDELKRLRKKREIQEGLTC